MAKQDSQPKFNLDLDQTLDSVEEHRFEPIKGYPMLHWKGKRPFTSTQYYPAQLKEAYGEEANGWMNKIFWGDNLQVMSHLLKEFRGQVDLVYIDPPFDSKADYKKKVSLKGKQIKGSHSSFEEKQYTDIWTYDEYLQFIYERIILIKELLSNNGSILLHCDWRKSHLIRCIFDEIFGSSCFRGHIVWRSMTSSGFKGKTSLGKSHDDVIYYSKSKDQFTYNPVLIPYSPEYLNERFNKVDENGRRFKDEKIGSATPQKTITKLKDEGKIYFTSNGTPRIKHYLDDAVGYPADDIWDDISGENSQSKLQTGYPTQKPEALLNRIISMTSNVGDLIFDCFMGSGTTQAVAMKLGRRFIGADINLGAIQTTTKRLIQVAKELEEQQTPEAKTIDMFSQYEEGITMAAEPAAVYETKASKKKKETFYTGFQVYNVNHYDVFRNPLEAKDLLMKALEIQPLPQNTLYDGEKDDRMVRIMPFDRIATRADLNSLITGFDYKTFEKRNDQEPGKPVESLLLVCMGHEPDLAATLQKEVPFKLDIEVVDILRDKSKLEFKREAEAELAIQNGKLGITAFYPMNLLQKLSLMKENVEDWRELTESIMIDFNYDGSIFEPTLVDVPEKNELVQGSYPIPSEAGTIRVKITDLLSESWEGQIDMN